MALNFKKAMGSRWVLMMGVGSMLLGAPACAPESDVAPAPTGEAKQSVQAPIGQTIWLKSCLTGKFVSADGNLGANSPLVADRATTAGWEHFQVVDAGGGTIALRVAETQKYVSADTNVAGRLVADRTTIGDWERFTWVEFADGNIGLLAKSTGKYVSTDTNRGANAPLYADRTTAGCWESFSIGIVGGGGGGGGKWVQIWGDEFDGTAVNTANWSYITNIHVNNEQQQYTTSGNNVQVSNGTLKLIARRENNNGYPFTSGRLETAGKKQFTHGAVEARLKMPVGPGLWPAFWMLGHDINSVGWPNCGELDIMENVGYGDWVSMALHGPGYSGNTPINGRYTFPSGNGISNWHTYRVEYAPTEIKWFVDGNLYKTVTKADVTRYGAWQYDKAQYIILNLAVGGGYPAGVNGATTPYYGVPQSTADLITRTPQVFEIDYVRAFQWQ
ncbi:family 16 glycosylhydrolase [Stigmatella sp. ncwal1]|uniref:Family 16 glycosylhydrolase n=1 Tax=Stigmatella ashevillensis TaxID=2995309 RepID=A0ABT5DK31_9BACT|nr:family 16 glycosylhydrolase [Stigmatella ashevillena]MDC0713488.1 family 16 glycosylhydrolase [Stigmatella ashevillena]